jgi:glycine betaine/proline transport system permease protein
MIDADPFGNLTLPIAEWISRGVDYIADEWRPIFQTLRWPATVLLNDIQALLIATPPSLLLALVFLIAWQLANLRIAIFSVVALTFIGVMGAWVAALTTIALIGTAMVFAVSAGFVIGIVAAQNDRVYLIIRPMLDVMQTLPAFVYLVPVVMLMGIGNVPGVIVSIVFSLPPMIRLTYLGIKEVPANIVEAAYAFGSSPRQVLFKVQVPLALPTIMAGVNQCMMMALAMTTYAAMIAAGGLGEFVLRGIGRLDMGIAAVGGIGIVLIAMTLDRITQAIARRRGAAHDWYRRGPIGIVLAAINVRNRSHIHLATPPT